MLIFLQNYKTNANSALHAAGYKEHPKGNGCILEESAGRFHAKTLSAKVIDLHYDTYVDGKHVVFFMPIKMHAELRRIQRRIVRWQYRAMDPDERTRLMQKWKDH